MSRFNLLTVREVRRETTDAVSIAFDVPPDLAEAYRFIPGQYLTLEAEIAGEPVRRSYSICSGLGDGELRVAVKRVDGGRFSTFANDDLRAGQALKVMPPEGRFTAVPDPTRARTYVAFAAGSGITPIIGIARSVLAAEPHSRFSLFYGNQRASDILFREALEDLKNRYPDRFSLMHVLSREPQEVALFAGRLDAEKCNRLFRSLVDVHAVDAFYLCGPASMAADIAAVLAGHGVPEEKVHRELFTPASGGGDHAAAAARAERRERLADAVEDARSVTVLLDGVATELRVATDGPSVLDAALALRPDTPYACKGGMCCTCRCKLVEGEVEMAENYSLEPWELDAGYILSCQARPLTEKVVLDFDDV